jgi:sortase A
MLRNAQIITLLLLLFTVLLAGCGGRSEAASAAAPPLPTAAVVVAHPPATPTVALHKEPAKVSLPERLVIPSIKLDTSVVELGWSKKQDGSGYVFSEWDVAQFAAGWHKNSSRIGEPGNMVMSGHNNIYGAVFRELDQLRRGDEITVWAEDEAHQYVVHDVLILPDKTVSLDQRKENAQWIGQFEDDRLTLVSCWPRDDNTHRIIVVAFPQGG